jgi:methionine salvage enolase-phosphatase E1
MTKTEQAAFEAMMKEIGELTAEIARLALVVGEMKGARAAAPAAKLATRKQPAGNVYEKAKLAINEARGYEPHAFVPKDMLMAKVAELQAA